MSGLDEAIEAVRSAMWIHTNEGHGCDEHCTAECRGILLAAAPALLRAVVAECKMYSPSSEMNSDGDMDEDETGQWVYADDLLAALSRLGRKVEA